MCWSPGAAQRQQAGIGHARSLPSSLAPQTSLINHCDRGGDDDDDVERCNRRTEQQGEKGAQDTGETEAASPAARRLFHRHRRRICSRSAAHGCQTHVWGPTPLAILARSVQFGRDAASSDCCCVAALRPGSCRFLQPRVCGCACHSCPWPAPSAAALPPPNNGLPATTTTSAQRGRDPRHAGAHRRAVAAGAAPAARAAGGGAVPGHEVRRHRLPQVRGGSLEGASVAPTPLGRGRLGKACAPPPRSSLQPAVARMRVSADCAAHCTYPCAHALARPGAVRACVRVSLRSTLDPALYKNGGFDWRTAVLLATVFGYLFMPPGEKRCWLVMAPTPPRARLLVVFVAVRCVCPPVCLPPS